MNDRNVSRKTHNGYSGATGYGKSYKDGKGYNGRNAGPSSLIQAAPKKRVNLRPVQLPSSTTEKTSGLLSSSSTGGWAKKDDRNGQIGVKSGEKAQSGAPTRPWSSQRGVPGLNQPEPSRTEFTELGNRNGSRNRPGNDSSDRNESSERAVPKPEVPKKQNPMLPNYMKPPEEQNRTKPETNDRNGDSYQNGSREPIRNEPIEEKSNHEPKNHEPVRMDDSDGLKSDDGFDPMESWADDKPVNWNEKIIFSDDDQTADKTPTPPNKEQDETNNDYDSRYDNHRYEDTRYDRRYNRNYDSRNDENYDSRRSTYRYEPPGARPGFYDDNERGYYEKDLEKSRKDPDQPGDLFSNRPRRSDSRSYDKDPRERRQSNSSRRHDDDNKTEAESHDSEGLIELVEEPIEEMPRRKIVRKPKAMLLRDFNHEEKGEEIDEMEPKMEEKEKTSKPRGWNKEPNDQKSRGRENPKKSKKSSSSDSKYQERSKNPKLPTADGSRQSKLDKENAEKEQANKNVWAERMSNKKKEDTDERNKSVFVPGADDMKRTLGDTGMTLKASKPLREPNGPSSDRHHNRDRNDDGGRDPKRKGPKENRRGEEGKKDHARGEPRDRYGDNRRDNNRRDENRDNRNRENQTDQKQSRDKRKHKNDENRYEEHDHRSANVRSSERSGKTSVPTPASGTGVPTPSVPNGAPSSGSDTVVKTEFVAAEPPRTNIWAERIKNQQQKSEEQNSKNRLSSRGNTDYDVTVNRDHGYKQDGGRDHKSDHRKKTQNEKRIERNEIRNRDRSDRKSRDTDHGSDVGGSKGNLAKFRENEKRKNEKRDFSGSNENVSRDNRSKKREPKKGGSNQRLNRLESKDDDEAPTKKPRRREEDPKSKKKESGSSTEDMTRSVMGRSSVRKPGLSERAGKRRNERSKRQERFKNAYEFPKPAEDIKDAQVPNVDAIRGGLSFRGLMRQRAGATCALRGSRADGLRNRSSDQSTNQEEEDEIIQKPASSVIAGSDQAALDVSSQSKPIPKDSSQSETLNVNAGEFTSTSSVHAKATFSPNRSGSNLGAHFPEPEVTGISFIALPSPNQNQLRSPAGPPTGIYGDTSSNSPQLVRVEDQSNSPIHIEESTLKKMERSRKAWDNAPASSMSFNGFQPTPGQNVPAQTQKLVQAQEETIPVNQQQKEAQNASFESSSQPISSELPQSAVNSTVNNWGTNTTNQTSSEWSKDAGGTTGGLSGATWGKSGQQSASDQWKKDQIPLQPQMNDVTHQLQPGMTPNPGLNQITQMSAYSRQNQFPGAPAAGLGDVGALTNPLNAHLLNSASYPASNQQTNQLSYPSFNNQNLFYNSQPQVAYNPSTQLIQQNQLNNAFEFGGQQNLYSNQLTSSSFNSINYGNDQRQSDFGFNNAYPGFDNTMLANLQRQTQSSNVLNFPQTSNGMNRYQSNITPNAFNLGMGAQQTQRPDMTGANLRPNIGNPHHSSNLFGKSPSPSPASLTKLMGGNHFGNDFAFNANANMQSFRLKTQTRSNSVTPPHPQRSSKRNDFNSFNMNGRGFDSSFESQKSYMSGNGNEFDPKMNQFMNRSTNANQGNQFDPVNAYFKQGNSFGGGFGGSNQASGGGFMNHGASGRNSRNGNPPGGQNRGSNGNLIGKFEKSFGSGPVGSKLDQKGIMPDGRNIKGQKKNMNKEFLPTQKERNADKQALISQVSELTNKFSSVGLDKCSAESSPTATTPIAAATPEQAADNIVLTVDDRKRLTLADTAPKGGGIRRIITQS